MKCKDLNKKKELQKRIDNIKQSIKNLQAINNNNKPPINQIPPIQRKKEKSPYDKEKGPSPISKAPNYKLLQEKLRELRKEYNNVLHTNEPLAEDLLRKLENIKKSLKNLHMNYILSFGKYAFMKDLFNWDIEDKYKQKLLAAIWVEDRNMDDWEKLSEEQKNAFAQYSKQEKLEHKKNLNEILQNLRIIHGQNYDRRTKLVKEAIDKLKSLIEDERINLWMKMRQLNPSISSSSGYFSSSYSDQEQPPEGEITYANPKLKKIPPGHDPLLELISKETV